MIVVGSKRHFGLEERNDLASFDRCLQLILAQARPKRECPSKEVFQIRHRDGLLQRSLDGQVPSLSQTFCRIDHLGFASADQQDLHPRRLFRQLAHQSDTVGFRHDQIQDHGLGFKEIVLDPKLFTIGRRPDFTAQPLGDFAENPLDVEIVIDDEQPVGNRCGRLFNRCFRRLSVFGFLRVFWPGQWRSILGWFRQPGSRLVGSRATFAVGWLHGVYVNHCPVTISRGHSRFKVVYSVNYRNNLSVFVEKMGCGCLKQLCANRGDSEYRNSWAASRHRR